MYSCIISEGLNDPEALHWAHWQTATFWLPLAQWEVAGWWTPPPMIPGLQFGDFMPSTASSDFWIMRQHNTMALAWVLQACAKESG